MVKVLYIKASPRQERSYSLRVAAAFVGTYRLAHPDHHVSELDLFETDLPPFDYEAITARYLAGRGGDMTSAQRAAWERVKTVVAEFASFDKYVLAVPMWNFSLPWRLKQYLDLLLQPGLTFKVVDGSYQGLMTGKKAFVAYSSGNEYPPGSPTQGMDFQKPYLNFILNFMGIETVVEAVAAPTLAKGPENAADSLQKAIAIAETEAKRF